MQKRERQFRQGQKSVKKFSIMDKRTVIGYNNFVYAKEGKQVQILKITDRYSGAFRLLHSWGLR